MFEVSSAVRVASETALPNDDDDAQRRVDGDFLFENIVCDLHWSALHIAGVSLLLRARLQTSARWTLRSWRYILFDNRDIMKLALRYGGDIGLTSGVAIGLSAFYDDLSAAKASIAPLMTGANEYGASELAAARRSVVEWRRMCRDSARMLTLLEPDVRLRLKGGYFEDSRTLAQFLVEATRGKTTRVSPWGEVALPPLSQRRRAPRIGVGRSCRLLAPPLTLIARLEDVSSRGLGVVCRHAFEEGQPVAVELEDGRVLQASVARQSGDSVGLRLAKPLPKEDPLFGRADAPAPRR